MADNDILGISVRYSDGCTITYGLSPSADHELSERVGHKHPNTKYPAEWHGERLSTDLSGFVVTRHERKQAEAKREQAEASNRGPGCSYCDYREPSQSTCPSINRLSNGGHPWNRVSPNPHWYCLACGAQAHS